MPLRIAIAGFQHETNTFIAEPTDLAAFEQADSWPEMLFGQNVVDQTKGMNLPIAGFATAAAQDKDVTLHPILWTAAEPGGRVEDHAYDWISARILQGLEHLPGCDAVYLDLHGAMVTQSIDDAEGDLLARVRALIGTEIPLIASLDMHANVTKAMAQAADALLIYRTYPHLDMADTGRSAYEMLRGCLAQGPPAKAWRQADYLIPLHAQHTGADPARALYAGLEPFDAPPLQSAGLALGFTAADIHDCGPSVLAYATTQSQADKIADRLLRQIEEAEAAFDCTLLSPEDAVRQATSGTGNGPVLIADVQDNPGAGASSDSTGLLRELIRQEAKDALLGLVHDPDLAAMAHATGLGGCFEATIGGRGPGDSPVRARVRLYYLSDGVCAYTGQMYGGGTATLGLSAALQLDGTSICIVVTSIRNQCLDLAHFRHFDLRPEAAQIVCVKSTAHFRADFEALAERTLLTAAPGQFPCQLEQVNFANLRPGLRRGPGGPAQPRRSDPV